jgi:GT2 family glycosyltransferase
MIPVVVCTIGSPALPVMKASMEAYAPEHRLLVTQGRFGSFGDDYNAAMTEAFRDNDAIIIANDDVVLTPSTMKLLLEDVQEIKRSFAKVGFVAARSDAVRPMQDIRNNVQVPCQVTAISPLFAWISKEAFELVKFAPINWFSDDVLCLDLEKHGFSHFISRSYVHHAGSTSIGLDNEKNLNDAKPWVMKNRPEYAKHWFNS